MVWMMREVRVVVTSELSISKISDEQALCMSKGLTVPTVSPVELLHLHKDILDVRLAQPTIRMSWRFSNSSSI